MRKITTVSLLSLLVFSSCQKEGPKLYNEFIAEARSLYATGEYEAAGKTYSEAFAVEEAKDSVLHQYEAARAWALAEKKDSAFAQLFRISEERKYADLRKIASDKELSSLRTDQRWIEVLKKVSENRKMAKAPMERVSRLLDTVYQEDQAYRQQLAGIQEKYGRDSKEVRAHWDLINEKDSVNLVKVRKVLDEHGWLGPDLIGHRANNALFLVIQHADIETQEEYLPLLRKAVKEGNAGPPDLALLEDRVALRQGKKQVYGSQLGIDENGEYYVSPLLDPDDVDQRRAEVGLGTMQGYLDNWDLTWDVEAYKKKLPELEAKLAK